MTKKEKELIIRVDDELHKKLKELANKHNTSISNIARILIFSSLVFMIIIKNSKSKEEITKKRLKKNILIYLKEKEYNYLQKIAKKRNEKISITIRSILELIIHHSNDKIIEKKIKYILELDKINFNLTKLEVTKKLYEIYEKTNLTACEVLEKILENDNFKFFKSFEYLIHLLNKKDN